MILRLFRPISRMMTPVTILLFVLLLLAAYVRIDFLRSVNHQMSPDAVNYDVMARQLLDDGVYAYHDTTPNAFVSPGYPLFLAGIYAVVGHDSVDPLPYVRYMQALLSVAAVWLIYRIAAKLAGSSAGLLAAALASIYPPLIWMNGAILTESVAVFALLLYVWVQLNAIDRASRAAAAAAGVLLGVTVLIRPEFLPLIAAVYGFALLRSKSGDRRATWQLFFLSCAGLVLAMLPWWIRNLVTLHEWVLTATQANPLSAGTYPYKQYHDGLIDTTGLTDRQIAIERLRVGFSTEPWLFLKWYTTGKLRYIYEYMYAGGGYTPYYPVLPLRDPNRFHLTIVWSSVAGMALLLRRWRQLATVPVLIVVVMSLIRLAFVPEYRYNITVMPLMIVIGCVAVTQLSQWILTGSEQQGGKSHDNSAILPPRPAEAADHRPGL